MTIRARLWGIVFLLLVISITGCVQNNPNPSQATVPPTPSPTTSPAAASEQKAHQASQLTLPVLDALIANESFVAELKSKLALTDDQVVKLKDVSSAEVSRLRTGNAEDNVSNPAAERSRASEQIGQIIGEDKTSQLVTLASEFWARGGEPTSTTDKQTGLPTVPNNVPTDTRIVVNTPSYRMDLFKDGTLIKSYKIGIGYPEFPLPQGLRKAQTVIFNPTWTPPDSPWVAKMKDIKPGEKVEAGSKLNPLGPIKVPIGMPSLIHGGKSPAKLGTFASHGCVGLTTAQVKDFARMLAQISDTDLSDLTINSYLKDPTQTRAVKLKQPIPVELRYETLLVEDGALHIYKDVYEQDTNTEENLRAVLEANGTSLDDLSDDERTQLLTGLNAMSAHPKAAPSASISEPKTVGKTAKNKKPAKSQKEIIVELKQLAGRGYPAPVNLDTGTGRSTVTAVAQPKK